MGEYYIIRAGHGVSGCNKHGSRCIIMGRVFVRLLSAIPLLFWVGTAAVAHFVHACVAAPIDLAADLEPGDPTLETVRPEQAVALTDVGGAHRVVPDRPADHIASFQQAASADPLQAGSRTMRDQVFASARLFANPPPPAA